MLFETNAVFSVQVLLDSMHIDESFGIKVTFKMGRSYTNVNVVTCSHVIITDSSDLRCV